MEETLTQNRENGKKKKKKKIRTRNNDAYMKNNDNELCLFFLFHFTDKITYESRQKKNK